jgi:cytochrome P450
MILTSNKTSDTVASLMILVGLVYLVWKAYISWIRKKFINKQTGEVMPGPEPIFLLGNLHWFFSNGFVSSFETKLSKYGPVVLFFFGPFPWIYTQSTEAFQRVYKNNRIWIRSSFSVALKGLFGNTLFVLEDEEWRRHRHLMNPFFNKDHIREFYAAICDVALKHIEETKKNAGQQINMKMWSASLTARVISKYAFGVYMDDIKQVLEKLRDLSRSQGTFTFLGVIGIPLTFPYMREIVAAHRKFFTYLYNRMKELETGDNVWGRLRSFQDENGKCLTEDELKSECAGMFIAGTDTTASTLLWLMKRLHENPQVREKLLNEVKQNFGDNVPTFDQLHSLKYLENVIYENLRLSSIVTLSNRISIREDEICGYSVPVGTIAWMSPHLVTRNSSYWPNDLTFNPDRFEGLDETSPEKKSVHLAFGYGPHVCIGQHLAMAELKLMAILLVRNLKWEFFPKSDWRPRNPTINIAPTLVVGTFSPL